MPRPAWLALGAAAGALALDVAAPLAVRLGAGCVLAMALVLAAIRRPRIALSAAAVGLGVLAIACRAGLANHATSASVVLPSGEGPWVGVVQGVGAPRAGSRPAIVLLALEPPLLVAVTLPSYPAVVPSDRIELHGRIRAPPLDNYGAYLARIGAAGTLRSDSLALLP